MGSSLIATASLIASIHDALSKASDALGPVRNFVALIAPSEVGFDSVRSALSSQRRSSSPG